ncbi:hypothetical protein Scep_020352 [Stephania cephalantha]|uniref:Uncharacterized protein n=1 Tax=Stephania cephalantha TaxID=152367 RepID=A0AAP0ID15_9MAGN
MTERRLPARHAGACGGGRQHRPAEAKLAEESAGRDGVGRTTRREGSGGSRSGASWRGGAVEMRSSDGRRARAAAGGVADSSSRISKRDERRWLAARTAASRGAQRQARPARPRTIAASSRGSGEETPRSSRRAAIPAAATDGIQQSPARRWTAVRRGCCAARWCSGDAAASWAGAAERRRSWRRRRGRRWRDGDDGSGAVTTAASARQRRRVGSGNGAVNNAMALSD